MLSGEQNDRLGADHKYLLLYMAISWSETMETHHKQMQHQKATLNVQSYYE